MASAFASPKSSILLITLSKVGHLDLLTHLATEILVPDAVVPRFWKGRNLILQKKLLRRTRNLYLAERDYGKEVMGRYRSAPNRVSQPVAVYAFGNRAISVGPAVLGDH
jgi:hypothetical protein